MYRALRDEYILRPGRHLNFDFYTLHFEFEQVLSIARRERLDSGRRSV